MTFISKNQALPFLLLCDYQTSSKKSEKTGDPTLRSSFAKGRTLQTDQDSQDTSASAGVQLKNSI